MTEPEAATIDVAGRQAALRAKGLMGDGSDRLGEQLKASVALMDQLPDGHAPKTADVKFTRVSSGGRMFAIGTCPVCKKPAEFWNRNRLANCGHVRRSHGKLVPRDEKPKAPAIAQQPAATLVTLVGRLKDLYETKDSRVCELEACRDTIAELTDNEARLMGVIDGLSEQIEATYAEMLKGK